MARRARHKNQVDLKNFLNPVVYEIKTSRCGSPDLTYCINTRVHLTTSCQLLLSQANFIDLKLDQSQTFNEIQTIYNKSKMVLLSKKNHKIAYFFMYTQITAVYTTPTH